MPVMRGAGRAKPELGSPSRQRRKYRAICSCHDRRTQAAHGGSGWRDGRRGDHSEQASYALENAVRLFAFFNDYFGVKYPLPKLDLIAVPAGSAAPWRTGAASSFSRAGCCSTRATNPDTARRGIFSVLAHEMAHQWFGDLTASGWWDNLWLNKAIASWMQDEGGGAFLSAMEELAQRLWPETVRDGARRAAHLPPGAASGRRPKRGHGPAENARGNPDLGHRDGPRQGTRRRRPTAAADFAKMPATAEAIMRSSLRTLGRWPCK